MKNLRVFIFQQHWFHLGSLLEATVQKNTNYRSIKFYYIDKSLFVKPLDRHQDFYGSRLFNYPPESTIAEYLETYFDDRNKDFSYNKVKLARYYETNDLFNKVSNIEELQKIQWEGTNIGLAVSSFLITLTKDSDPNLKKYKTLISNLKLTYLQIFQYLDSLHLVDSRDEIWICNGRPFHERAVVEYARKNSISLKFYEIGGEGSNQERWILHENSPHDRRDHQESIVEHFKLATPDLSLIAEWFKIQRPGGQNKYSKNFESNTKLDSLDNYFVYFSSSDDEVSAISSDWSSTWGKQLNAVNSLINFFITKPNLTLIIRVHPNQKNKSRNDKKKWKKLRNSLNNVIIFNYDSNIDSYKLLSRAKGIFTYGSTIGVEAAYLRIPSALLANSRWDSIIPHEYLKSEDDIANWVNKVNGRKLPDDIHIEDCYLGSLMWGNYMMTAGNKWNIIERKKDFRNVNVGYLAGKALKPPFFVIVITRFFRFVRLYLIERRIDLSKMSVLSLKRDK
jgi:hypothetical protein